MTKEEIKALIIGLLIGSFLMLILFSSIPDFRWNRTENKIPYCAADSNFTIIVIPPNYVGIPIPSDSLDRLDRLQDIRDSLFELQLEDTL